MSQTATKMKDTTISQLCKMMAEISGCLFLTDVLRTGKVLGRGQSSVVEEVVCNGEVCAMKVPSRSFDKFQSLIEARMLTKLKHPHILKLIGLTMIGDDERVSLVLEKGAATLRQLLSSYQKETVPLQLKLQILQQVSEALQYLHTQEPPMVHGDISSTNIYLTDQYQVKLGDFGSADTVLGYGRSRGYINSCVYEPSTPIWTIDTRSDIIAFGVLMIEVISHQEPLPTEYVDVKTSVLYTEVQRRQKYIDQFSTEEKEHFVPTIEQCLAESEDDRPQASGLVTKIHLIRSVLGIHKLVTAKDLNLSLPSSLSSVPPLNRTYSFKDLHQFKLSNVNQTGVELGGGSFSVVYKVEWKQRICAAKHFIVFGHKPEAIDQIALSLARECGHWLELKHPHIVETLGWCEKDTSPFPIIVMEKLDMSLKSYLVSCNKDHFPLTDKAAILLQVATAIQFLHTRSPPLVHGDITANNVMLKGCPPHCTAKLADFGLTRVFDLMSITPQSVGRGTYAYISPEFFAQPPAITEKTDNFCFGILMIHTITHNYPIPTASAMYKGGDQPVKACTELERRQEHIRLFTLQEKHCLEDIIRHCLEIDPEERPTSTVILAQMTAAQETVAAQQVGPIPETPPSFSEHPMAKRKALQGETEEDTQSRVQLVQAIKQLSSEFESRFTADWCISIIRAEEVLSEYAVADIEAEEHPIKKTAKLFQALQKVEVDNAKRFCLSIINNLAFPPGTPEHEFARRLLIKIKPKPQSSA